MRHSTDANQRTITNALRIILNGEKPTSLNKFYAGMHHSQRTRLKNEQQLLVRSQIDPNMEPFNVPVKITFTIYYPTKRVRDIDNATVKMYIDGLKPFVIVDDDWRYVKSVEKVYEYDKDNPRIEILVEPYKKHGYYEMLDKYFPNFKMEQFPVSESDMEWAKKACDEEVAE